MDSTQLYFHIHSDTMIYVSTSVTSKFPNVAKIWRPVVFENGVLTHKPWRLHQVKYDLDIPMLLAITGHMNRLPA